MSVTRAEIQRIAELEGQLSRILDYVAQLRELPPDGAGAADEAALRLRRDEVKPDPLERPPAEFAPAMKQGLFLVPHVAELAPGAADE